jgi:ribonuclease P protein component
MRPHAYLKEHRLRKRHEYTRLRQGARKRENPYFIIVFAQNTGETNRLGITVTRKTGKATRRNRIKRLAREVFRKWRPRSRGHLDINIIAKHRAVLLGNPELFRALEHAFGLVEKEN